MGFQQGPVRCQPFGLVPVLVRLRGTGAAAPAVEIGPNGEPASASATSGLAGCTVTRAGAGDYTVVFSEKPGELVAVTPGHGADNASATTRKHLEWDSDSMTATGQSVRILVILPATEAVASALSDLATTEVMSIIFWFRVGTINPA